jgi:hypothetical protein
MSNSPEDIIELTDIIEHGPGAPGKGGAADGVDLSFERELEDLFGDTPADKPAKAAKADEPELPGMDELVLPEEPAKAEGEGEIDMDGLDALLAEAEKSQAASDISITDLPGADLPELTDDFLAAEPAAKAGPAAPKAPAVDPFDAALAGAGVAAAAAAPPAPAASSESLAALAARMDAIEDKLGGLGDSFKSMLDEALDAFKAGMPAALDEDALASRIKDEVVAALPEPAAALVPESAADPAPLIEELKASLEAQIESLRSELPQPLDEEALAGRIKDEILAALPAPAEATAADPAPLIEELKASFEAQIESLRSELPQPLDEEALAGRIKDEILAAPPAPAAPDLSGLPSKEDLAAVRQEVMAEMRKAVPAAAAQVIREEIKALVETMD